MATPYVISSDLVSAYPAKSLEIAQYIDGFKADLALVQNAQTGTTYTLAATDFTTLVTLSNASPVTVTVPLESSVAWVAGTQLRLMNLGAGLVTVAGAVGVTVNGAATLPQYSSATLVRTASDAWTIYTSSSAWDRRVQVEERQTAGTAGGTFTTGAWRTRVLNTSMINNVAGASLASSQLTLPAGTYAAEAFAAVGVNVGVHQTRIQDITGAATLLTGLVLRAPTAGSGASGIGPSSLAGEFTLTTSSAIELQHRCSVTEATVGFGYAGSFTTEVYSRLIVWKL
jgi:hypothetical protein